MSERIALENRIGNLLCLHGVSGFKPRLKKAVEHLEALRCFDGAPLPEKLMEEPRRLMARPKGGHDEIQQPPSFASSIRPVLDRTAVGPAGGMTVNDDGAGGPAASCGRCP